MIEFEFADNLLIPLENRDGESEDRLDTFGEDEVEY